MKALWLLLIASALVVISQGKSFTISNDRFILDGEPVQIISGSIHYFRVPKIYWEDRLLRLKAMGLNTVQIYIPWNKHETLPGTYDWTHNLAVTDFLEVAGKVGLWVILRAGPYICAEWDAGGLPWWLASSTVSGGGSNMKLRSNDTAYLQHVDHWWSIVLPKLAPYAWSRGGPIIMVQVENEYGFCGSSKSYIRSLVASVKEAFGKDMIIFTTDPPGNVERGSIAGDEVYTVVDFGPQVDPEAAFKAQRAMNPKGKSPPFCSEFYTGWLTHWGQSMPDNSAEQMVDSFTKILKYANGSGSVNLYMAHGGTNFGFYAGAGLSGMQFLPQITSYDYTAPLSEQGRTGQPGIGGANKYEMLRQAISKHTGEKEREWPKDIPTADYGEVNMTNSLPLLDAVPHLFPGEGIATDSPKNMEEYNQGHGAILYSVTLPETLASQGGNLQFGAIHDYAHIFLDGELVAYHARGSPIYAELPALNGDQGAKLDVLVHAMGRDSGGCSFDLKGMLSNVKLDGTPLTGWRVFPLPFDNLHKVQAHLKPGIGVYPAAVKAPLPPVIFRGKLVLKQDHRFAKSGFFADTFLDLSAWGKGVAFVNGFNLGWYWPSIGPQNHYYIPGPLLKEGGNEIVLVEVEKAADSLSVKLVEDADLRGPRISQLLTHPMKSEIAEQRSR